MKICGIVCEYNPFHTGHQFHIEQARKQADAIVCVMSGNFVQRGEPAIIRKHIRAESAVRGGADLVFELPTPWSVASAERFANGAIALLTSISELSSISFGSESININLLKKTVELLNSEQFVAELKSNLDNGISFAAAREKAIATISKDCADILRDPNNILAIEYLKALQKSPNINIIPVKRQGVPHDSQTVSNEFTSASYLRNIWKNNNFEEIKQYLPGADSFVKEIVSGHAPAGIEYLERAMLAVLKQKSAQEFETYADTTEGLHHRILNALSQASTLADAIDLTKSKRYAHARIRRIFLNAFLGIHGEICKQKPPYLRVLAFNDTGREILSNLHFQLPVITKPTQAKELHGFAKEVFELEAKATDLYALAMPTPVSGQQEWKISPIYFPGKHKTV